jgi:hypothetical protein
MMRSVVLDQPLQREAREAIATCGERGVAEACNLSSLSLFRAVAGAPVSRGTAALIERGLERVRKLVADALPDNDVGRADRVEGTAQDGASQLAGSDTGETRIRTQSGRAGLRVQGARKERLPSPRRS